MEEKKYNLNFMYKKISVPRPVMVTWLNFPAFVEMMENKVANNITIDDHVVYEAIKELYFPRKYYRDKTGQRMETDFNHTHTRKGLRCLSEKLFNDADHWVSEYEQYLGAQE